jgi:putrescine aminotransferase
VELLHDPDFVPKLMTSAVVAELYESHGILTFFGSNVDIPLVLSPCLVATDEELDRLGEALDQTLSLGWKRLLVKFARAYLGARVGGL